MEENRVESDPEPMGRFDKAKKYVKDNWQPIAIGAGVTVVTIGGIIVTKRVIFPRYLYMHSGGSNFILHRPRFWKSPVYFVTNMFGAPYNRLSRVVRCVETGHETLSISQMAKDMSLNRSQINQHLNFPDLHPSVGGYHFESLGYTLPNEGNWGLSSG